MTETVDITGTAPEAADGAREPARKRRGSGLDAMVLPELKQMAGTLGIRGTGAMRKSQLIDAIQSAQRGQPSAGRGTRQRGWRT